MSMYLLEINTTGPVFFRKIPSIILDQEVSVLKTLMMLGQIVGADKRLEVLLTSAVMRGFR